MTPSLPLHSVLPPFPSSFIFCLLPLPPPSHCRIPLSSPFLSPSCFQAPDPQGMERVSQTIMAKQVFTVSGADKEMATGN